jgi:hypothetical protein
MLRLLGVQGLGVVELISAGGPAGGQAWEGCRSFLRPSSCAGAWVGMMGCAVLRSAESIRRRDHAGTPWCSVRGSGGHDLHDYASTSLWAPAPHVATGGGALSARTRWSRRA